MRKKSRTPHYERDARGVRSKAEKQNHSPSLFGRIRKSSGQAGQGRKTKSEPLTRKRSRKSSG